MRVPILNFEEGPGVPLLNFEGGPVSRVPGSPGPGPTFTPWQYKNYKILNLQKQSSRGVL